MSGVMFKILDGERVLRLSDGAEFPHDPDNRDFVVFADLVADRGLGIVEGETVVTPGYVQQRVESGYPDVGEQIDILYHGGLGALRRVLGDVKREYPKSLAATEDILPLPEWCSGLEDA